MFIDDVAFVVESRELFSTDGLKVLLALWDLSGPKLGFTVFMGDGRDVALGVVGVVSVVVESLIVHFVCLLKMMMKMYVSIK